MKPSSTMRRNFLLCASWCLLLLAHTKTHGQNVKVTDLGFENFKAFYLNGFRVPDLLTVDSLASVYESWKPKPLLNNRSYSELNGSRSFDLATTGLEVNYAEPDGDAGSGSYQFRELIITGHRFELKFKDQSLRVGMSINQLTDELRPGLDKRNNDYMVYHFSPVDISFSIYFDLKTEKITKLKFFNYFY